MLMMNVNRCLTNSARKNYNRSSLYIPYKHSLLNTVSITFAVYVLIKPVSRCTLLDILKRKHQICVIPGEDTLGHITSASHPVVNSLYLFEVVGLLEDICCVKPVG